MKTNTNIGDVIDWKDLFTDSTVKQRIAKMDLVDAGFVLGADLPKLLYVMGEQAIIAVAAAVGSFKGIELAGDSSIIDILVDGGTALQLWVKQIYADISAAVKYVFSDAEGKEKVVVVRKYKRLLNADQMVAFTDTVKKYKDSHSCSTFDAEYAIAVAANTI